MLDLIVIKLSYVLLKLLGKVEIRLIEIEGLARSLLRRSITTYN